MIHNWNVIYLMAKIQQELSETFKKLSIKKLHIKVSNFLSKKNLQSLHGPKIFCGSRSTHGLARNARITAC